MSVLATLISLYLLVLVVRAVFSWLSEVALPEPLRWLERGCYLLTEPLLRPLRRVVPDARVGGYGIDVSFLVLFVILIVVQRLVA